MKTQNQTRHDAPAAKPGIGKIIIDDLRSGDLPRNLIQEFKDLYQFYLDYESKAKLAKMNYLRRGLKIGWWILKSLFYKLTPVRRLMLLLGIVLTLSQTNEQNNQFILGLIIIIIVLMLELKDKLLARDELKIGRAVQMSLMPDRLPQIPGWDCWLYTRPANDVGGDLIDFMQLAEKEWCLSLGDVAGKGLGAALLTAKLQATIRALAPESRTLSQLGQSLNKIFCRDGLAERFVTLIYLVFKSDSATVKYLNAGHMPPLLISADEVRELKKGNLALGISKGAKFSEQKIKLNRNDILIIYSDGVTDSCNSNHAFFGEQRFFNLLATINAESAEQIGTKIIHTLDNFVLNARQHDDVSLMILKRLD